MCSFLDDIDGKICCLWWKDRSHWLPLPWTNWSMVESSAEFSQYLSRGQYLQYCRSNIFAGNWGQLCCKLWEFWRSRSLADYRLHTCSSLRVNHWHFVSSSCSISFSPCKPAGYTLVTARERIVAVFVLSNGRFPLPSPFSSDDISIVTHCHHHQNHTLSSCCFYSNTFVDAHIGRRDYQCPWVDLFCHPDKYDEFIITTSPTITIIISPPPTTSSFKV